MPDNRWSASEAARLADDLDRLVYRSNLLGSDSTIVNFGGGNTSVKVDGQDHTGRSVKVLWIKGSGLDLATITRSGFTPLKLDDIELVRERAGMTDEEMVEYLSHCALDPRAPRPSIETMLQAFLPFPNVDHTHPEAAIAFCCTDGEEEASRECFGEEVLWVPYVRPGFALAKLAVSALETNPQATAMFLAKHGLVTWGETGEESYQRTIDLLTRAEEHLVGRGRTGPPFGGRRFEPLDLDRRRSTMLDLLPAVRGKLSRLREPGRPLILKFDDSPEVMEFVCSGGMKRLAEVGAACPDHVMYTKFRPLALEKQEPGDWSVQEVCTAIDEYVEEYERFFDQHKGSDVPMLDPGPRVILIPGLGLIAAGRGVWSASNTAALYRSAIRIMRGASALGTYTSLTPKEAWDIEYWPLELYKLTMKPAPKGMAGKVAVITGAAGAIGQATARRLMREDAHVVLADIDEAGLKKLADCLEESYPGRALSVTADASSETGTDLMLEMAVHTFGGADVMVPNAGVASAGPIDDTSTEEWERVHDVLSRGYFLACRAAFRLFKKQGMGGSIVINSSKNGTAAARNAIAYTTAKAAEAHMARCLAEEGGEFGIRVNAVAPDAVIEGSGLWTREWREERARTYGFDVDELEEYYRQRNALKVKITADDVAEAILFLASDRSAKTTGCTVTVDGGVAAAYPR